MEESNRITYNAAAGTHVIATGAAELVAILVGADVASSVVKVYDGQSAAAGTQIDEYGGDALMTSCAERHYGAYCQQGITIVTTNQTKITVIWKPTGSDF